MLSTIFGYGFLALVGAFLQTSFFRMIWPNAIVPDVFCAMVVIIGLRNRDWPSLLGAFALGLLADLTQARYLGPEAGAAVMVFMFAGVLADRVYADKYLALAIVVAICALLKQLFIFGMLSVYVSTPAINTQLIVSILLEVICTAIFSPLVAKVLLMSGCLSTRSSRLNSGIGAGGAGLLPNKPAGGARVPNMRALYR